MTDLNDLNVDWVKASRSGSQNACLEFADTTGQTDFGGVALRDTKAAGRGVVLLLHRSAMRDLLAGAKRGELDGLL